VEEAVEHGGGDGGVAEDLAPGAHSSLLVVITMGVFR